MADNFLYIPLVNAIRFYETTRENLPKYFTKHIDDFMFPERLYAWESEEDYCWIWQTTDIITLQFESSFDPIIVRLLDQAGNVVIEEPALIGLPNEGIPGLYAFEIAMSLAGVATGCYRVQLVLGSAGPEQKILISDCQYISATPIENSLLLEYWNSRYSQDVVWESGIQMQIRIHGHFGRLDPGRKDEFHRDQRYNPALLSSKTLRQWPVHFGNEYGIPDEIIDILNRIWSCDNVLIDGKPFGIADGGKFEFLDIEGGYPKRGVKIDVEEGINRNSRIFALTTDTTKKLITTIIVEAKVFGDTSNQGSMNTVPVLNIE